jgi:anti-sigma28 factor (negative regulator of flagellin synthesis)
MNYDFLTKKENRMVAENIYGFRKLNTTNNNNSNNSDNSENTKQQRSKKNSKGTEVHPRDIVEGRVAENSIEEIPIGFPVDGEKLKELKKKIKKEDEKIDYENDSIQENED